MIQISIDQEVFEFLEKNAKPFVDTPNTVLRRLLKIDPQTTLEKKGEKTTTPKLNQKETSLDTSEFVQIVLQKEFTEEFRKKSPYRFMFESSNTLIYFQNFNQESATLWYRVNEKPLNLLKSCQKKSFLCLTNPAEKMAYLIPIQEIKRQIACSNYTRNYLEINIDHISRRWKELDWPIGRFLKSYLP